MLDINLMLELLVHTGNNLPLECTVAHLIFLNYGSPQWLENDEKSRRPDDVPKYLELKRDHSEVITELCYIADSIQSEINTRILPL